MYNIFMVVDSGYYVMMYIVYVFDFSIIELCKGVKNLLLELNQVNRFNFIYFY